MSDEANSVDILKMKKRRKRKVKRSKRYIELALYSISYEPGDLAAY